MLVSLTNLSRKDVTTIIYSILTRKGFSLKFKLKLYTKDTMGEGQYYYQEFLLEKNKVCVNVSPRSYIEMGISNQSNEKTTLYINELYRDRIIRKLQKIYNSFEAYDCNEIDFIIVDQTGTRIHSEIAAQIKITQGLQTIVWQPVLQENKVMMSVMSDGHTALLSVQDFLLMYKRLKEINFTDMNVNLMTYLYLMPFGENRQDFRKSLITNEKDIDEAYASSYSKISLMGSLIDIENPGKLIPTKLDKPKW